MSNQRLIIFQDSVKLSADPQQWGDIDRITIHLIQMIKIPGMDYVISDPSQSVKTLFKHIDIRDGFSSIIDLSGLVGVEIQKRTRTPVATDFHLSRLRRISSPMFDGAGFILSLNPDQVRQLMQTLDVSRPLIIDDVGWSGRTLREVIRIFDLPIPLTTLALFAENDGIFGPKPTDLQTLKDEGATIVSGEQVTAPRDDGFHLVDFVIPGKIEEAFDLFISMQQLREQTDGGDESTRRNIGQQIARLLQEHRQLLFPNAITTGEVVHLFQDGRLTGANGISKNSFFDVNPPNWTMPSFASRIRSSILRENRRDILDIIGELRGIIDEGKEPKTEVMQEITIRSKERL